MRKILFRGKRIDNGEWVYGYYGVFGDTHQIFVPNAEARFCGKQIYGAWHIVDPETVGEFTGFMDKNGTKVFEGDIVQFTDRLDGQLIGEVYCDEILFDWRVYVPILRTVYFFANSKNGKCEVIGNKWDNADLLEGDR